MHYVERPYRHNSASNGLIYMEGQEQAITIKNLSITGALVQLNSKQGYENTRDIYNVLSASTSVGVRFPTMYLAADAEVVRVDMDDSHTFIAMEFKNIGHDVADLLYRRKSYRKNITASVRILLNSQYFNLTTINASAGGLMVFLGETITAEEGVITMFESKQLELEAEIKVIWVYPDADAGTLLGLQYRHIVRRVMDGIPCFDPKQTA